MSQIISHEESNRQPLRFDFNGNPLTATYDERGEPRFIASDVCKILDIGNIAQAVARLDDDEKGITTVYTLGGSQDVLTVNESGLYSLVLTSRKKEAKAFKRWITHEVLPAIRKTGKYEVAPASQPSALEALKQIVNALDYQQRQLNELNQNVGNLALDVESIHAELLDADYYTVRQWCIKQRIKHTSAILSMWGRAAKALSSASNIEIKDAIEGPYPVGRYHKSVLLVVCVPKQSDNGQLRLLGNGR